MANYDLMYEGPQIDGILNTGKKLEDDGYIFLGVAATNTSGGTPTKRVYYFAGPGTYAGFGTSTTIPSGSVGIFKYDGSSWSCSIVAVGGGGSYDVSAEHGGATYASLSAAIAAIPAIERKAGMEIKFVKTSTSKYEYWSYIGTSTTSTIFENTTNWVGVDAIPTNGSKNLLESGGVYTALNAINEKLNQGYLYYGFAATDTVPVVPGQKIFYIATSAGTYSHFLANGDIPIVLQKDGLAFICGGVEADEWNAEENLLVDDEPTAGSENLVKSGGVYSEIQTTKNSLQVNIDGDLQGIFDSSSLFNEEVIDSSAISELSGCTITKDGVISSSSIANAKVEYFRVSKGDVIKITITQRDEYRVAFGLFSAVPSEGNTAYAYNAYPVPIHSGFMKYFGIEINGYFAIYTINPHTLSKLSSKVLDKDTVVYDFATPYKVFVNYGINAGGNLYANNNRCCTDYIDITAFNKLVYTRAITNGSGNLYGLAFYDENKVFIQGSGIWETHGGEVGYTIFETNIPEGAVYARFTFWKDTKYGKFWFGDPTKDPTIKKLYEQRNPSLTLNATRIEVDGQGNTFVKKNFDFGNARIVKVCLEDITIPTSEVIGDSKFLIGYEDANSTYHAIIRFNKENEIINSEYYAIIPSDAVKLYIGGRCSVGNSIVCDVLDVTDEYPNIKSITADNIQRYDIGGSYNRALFNFEIGSGTLFMINPLVSDLPYSYQINGVTVNSDHTTTNVITNAWSNTLQMAELGNNYTFGRIQLRKSDNSVITDEDIADFLDSVEIIVRCKDKKELVLADNEKKMLLAGLTVSSNALKSDFCVKPKQDMTLKVHLPSWVKVRFYGGLRDGRVYTNYYYDGDEVPLTYLQGGMNTYVYHIDNTVEMKLSHYNALIGNGEIAFTYNSKDGYIIERNFDSEKYMGAIRSTPVTTDSGAGNYNIPTIVHVSDIHGDVDRFNAAYDYADYLKADIVINTGDNPFFNMSDGVLFHDEVVFAHAANFANCIGNHDTYDSSVANILAKNIVPFAETYGYHKLSSSDVTDKGYYYKDLDAQKLRIIAIDEYDGITQAAYKARVSSDQINWFISTLAATPAGYGVIVIMHQAPHTINAISGKIGFNDVTMDPQIAAIDSDYMRIAKITGNPFGKIIDAFIDKTTVSGSYTQKNAAMSDNETISYAADFTSLNTDVEFICYLNGHTHRDFIGYVADCENNQLNLNICSTSPISQSTGMKSPCDIMRGSNGANQDAFNVYTIDRTNHRVGICRIGANLSNDLRDRKVMWVSYV